MLSKIGGRKAAACLTGLVAIVGIYLFKGGVSGDLVDAIKFLVTTYLAGNIAGDVVGVVEAAANKPKASSPEASFADPSPRLAQLEQAVGMQAQTIDQLTQIVTQQK